MKKTFVLFTLTTLTTAAFAQERDYGNLVPEPHFQITQKKTSLLDNADIANYQINVTPKREDFVYKVNGVTTPKKNVFSKKRKDFKLSVDREDGKVTHISSVSFTDNGGSGVEAIQSSSISPEGYVSSTTHCYDNFNFSIFGKRSKEGYQCVTLNRDVCEYLEKNEINSALVEQINSCTDVLNKLSEHQVNLLKISFTDQKKDLKVLDKLKNKISKATNFYEVKAQTLADVSKIVSGYGSALSHCAFLKDNDYIAPKETVQEQPSPEEGQSAQGQ